MSRGTDALIRAVVSCCFVGYLPLIPGTFGAAFGCLIVGIRPRWFEDPGSALIIVLGAIILSICFITWLRSPAKDPPYIVIDEMIGIFVTMAGHRITLRNTVIGFVLFRIFDIVKPPPVRNLEALPGGYGIVADDVMAGVFASLALFFLEKLW